MIRNMIKPITAFPPDYELSEGFHHLPRVAIVKQDFPRRRDIKPQPEQRCDQQKGGEHGEFQRFPDIHRHDENQKRQRDIQYK